MIELIEIEVIATYHRSDTAGGWINGNERSLDIGYLTQAPAIGRCLLNPNEITNVNDIGCSGWCSTPLIDVDIGPGPTETRPVDTDLLT